MRYRDLAKRAAGNHHILSELCEKIADDLGEGPIDKCIKCHGRGKIVEYGNAKLTKCRNCDGSGDRTDD